MQPGGAGNRVRGALASGRFFLAVECTSPPAGVPREDALRPILALARSVRDDPRIDAITLTDRSRSDHDHDPVGLASAALRESGIMPVAHLAGKDRSPDDLEAALTRAAAEGLEAFLLITGDRVRHPPPDRPVRYLDSVNALQAARRRSPAFLLAAAVCPFKYREEELCAQYVKAEKKLAAGADLLITQIGWDMRKHAEARRALDGRGRGAPLAASLLLLTAARARRLRAVGLPGVVVTDELLRKLVEEERRGPEAEETAAYRRLALQIVGVRHMGYAGAQITGLHSYGHITRLLDAVDAAARDCPTPRDWDAAWAAMLTFADGRPVGVAPARGLYLDGAVFGNTGPRVAETLRYRALRALDRVVFHEGSAGARLLGPRLERVDARSGAGRALLLLETAVKAPLVGCRQCGSCRLPLTAYVCPETCPKGLANGPCGGTTDNRCEFGDRECVHNAIYRLSKAAGRPDGPAPLVIPPVPEALRGTCSWITYFQGTVAGS